MPRLPYLLSAFGIICFISLSVAQQPCNPNHLPLQLGQLAQSHPIDNCSCTGSPKGDPGSQIRIANDLQNSIKNNFLAQSTSHPKDISVGDMIRLQGIVDHFTQAQLPRGDRFTLPSPNQRMLLNNLNLGGGRVFSEREVVRLAGFVLDAHHSDVDSGESVNCDRLGCSNNDIHIEVAANPRNTAMTKAQQMNREGVVAEITPRHRPQVWDTFDSPDYSQFFKTHPVMFIGQLFYDASHHPGGGPARAAVWEVHPVYAIFVCLNTTPQACPLNQQNNGHIWMPFHMLKNSLHLTTVHVTQQCHDNP